MSASELITVVVPAFNAEATIDETLRSVRAQSHADLEIIIVDDGSTDATRSIAEMHARLDPRIRLLTQVNAGVAAARNKGWRQARSDLIAFIDADDLWTADKVERQYDLLRAQGPEVGLVYSWYAAIDENSRIMKLQPAVKVEGDVLDAVLRGNFVGNGSAALVRREALIAANGFDPALLEAGAQGCEDLLFYSRVAEHFQFALVPAHQIGYRHLPNNMSSNLPRMLCSWMMVADEMSLRHRNRRDAVNDGLANYTRWLVRHSLATGRPGLLFPIVAILLRRRFLIGLYALLMLLPLAVAAAARIRLRKRFLRRPRPDQRPGMRFEIGEPVGCR